MVLFKIYNVFSFSTQTKGMITTDHITSAIFTYNMAKVKRDHLKKLERLLMETDALTNLQSHEIATIIDEIQNAFVICFASDNEAIEGEKKRHLCNVMNMLIVLQKKLKVSFLHNVGRN